MREFLFTTWNTQGAAISDEEKHQVLVDLVKEAQRQNRPRFFAIQESGANPELHGKLASVNYQDYWVAPPKAANLRCTVGFLIPKGTKCRFTWINCGNVRYIAICDLEIGLRLGSIHAVSSAKAGIEVGAALNQMDKYNLPFILAGDMNSCPPQSTANHFQIIHTGQATQMSGNELDYFFASSSVRIADPYLTQVDPSDHNPVTALVTI